MREARKTKTDQEMRRSCPSMQLRQDHIRTPAGEAQLMLGGAWCALSSTLTQCMALACLAWLASLKSVQLALAEGKKGGREEERKGVKNRNKNETNKQKKDLIFSLLGLDYALVSLVSVFLFLPFGKELLPCAFVCQQYLTTPPPRGSELTVSEVTLDLDFSIMMKLLTLATFREQLNAFLLMMHMNLLGVRGTVLWLMSPEGLMQ